MTGEKPAQFVPDLWANAIWKSLLYEGSLLRWAAERERLRDVQLRAEHPWRWKAVHLQRWAWRRWHALARAVPVRWVGFGQDWVGRWEW